MKLSTTAFSSYTKCILFVACFVAIEANVSLFAQAVEKPTLVTSWSAEVSANNALPEYPRPQLRRSNWENLNGTWEYAITSAAAEQPLVFDGDILVPYPVESMLSGVQKHVAPEQRLWYRRNFLIPELKKGERLLLNFGAVDWQATVWVNGLRIHEHHGGYDPFTFDITEAAEPGENEIVVSVWDPTDAGIQPRGKQIQRPHGIWYTAVTGIWQTVWLETVPESYIQTLHLTPNASAGEIKVRCITNGSPDEKVRVVVRDGDQVVATAEGPASLPLTIEVPNAKLWSPSSPHLYDLVIMCEGGDRVESYFGLRDVALGKDDEGVTRIMLNGEPLFQFGILDQGWWPDGLYTAPTDEALRYDLDVTKRMGFNMVRKHVKVEPARWYYWCDKLGLLVWQDMPSGDKYIGGGEPDIIRTKESGDNFEQELKAMINTHFNHPSIVMWVAFNEGWGQWETGRITKLLKQWDPTRLVNSTSGWADRNVGDVHDYHIYPGPAMPKLENKRAVVLGEFGGLGLTMPDHLWQAERNWGYRTYANKTELYKAYKKLITQLNFLVGQGLSAAVYTQTTDVEIEINGLMTYDRAVIKFPPEMAKLNAKLYKPAPTLAPLVPTSEDEPQTWQYTFSKPPDGWHLPDFDDSSWAEGQAGFGSSVPETNPRTEWLGNNIWLRRTVDFPNKKLSSPQLRIYHDENTDIYINGGKIASVNGYTVGYRLVPIGEQHAQLLQPGPMTIAVHCQQSLGGQFIDIGIVDMIPNEQTIQKNVPQNNPKNN